MRPKAPGNRHEEAVRKARRDLAENTFMGTGAADEEPIYGGKGSPVRIFVGMMAGIAAILVLVLWAIGQLGESPLAW